MTIRSAKISSRSRSRKHHSRRWKPARPGFEMLEPRLMLDAAGMNLPPAIVLGRTLATPSTAASSTPSPSYFVGEVENNQVTITYTVYNEQADSETGVLLTTTLEPGVTFVSSSVTLDGTTPPQLPDQSGQNMAWSLGTIQGYDRESVAVTVSLVTPIPLQLDTGASAWAMLDAGAVSASTPAVTLQPGNVSDPSLLTSTVDADTNDPFIQEEAASLDYSAQNIFNFLHARIGYNSYLGSVRGARGTLWSNAGNALDVASLGVALMCASGIPAQYVSGTLSQSDAQDLILSMFPASYQTVGYIPAGTQVSAPANDPQLLSETESHYWFQFDTGSGMTDADPLIPGAAIGQTFTTSTGTFSAVPQSLEATTEIQLVAEIYSQASALFGLSSGLQDTTVLDQTFDDVELVGRPLSIGNFVTSTTTAAIFTTTVNTYSPYIDMSDLAYPNGGQDVVTLGKDYQETLTDFPLASQVLTGLFLDVTMSEPQVSGSSIVDTIQKTVFDRIGYVPRQNGTIAPVSVAPNTGPATTEQDVVTLNVSAAAVPTGPLLAAQSTLNQEAAEINALIPSGTTTLSPTAQPAVPLSWQVVRGLTALAAGIFNSASAQYLQFLGKRLDAAAYEASPQIVAVSTLTEPGPAGQPISGGVEIDILRDQPCVYASSLQPTSTAMALGFLDGLADSFIEQDIFNTQDLSNGTVAIGAMNLFLQAMALPGASLAEISSANLADLPSLNLPAEATARIATAVDSGSIVLVPTMTVDVSGTPRSAWLQMNPASGDVIAVLDNGAHTLEEQGPIRVPGPAITGQQAQQLVQLRNLLQQAKGLGGRNAVRQIAQLIQQLKPQSTVAAKVLQGVASATEELLALAYKVAAGNTGIDPPLGDVLFGLASTATASAAGTSSAEPAIASGAVAGSEELPSVATSGQIQALWSSGAADAFQVGSLNVSSANVVVAGNLTIKSGSISLTSISPILATFSGDSQYGVDGSGTLSFYGPAESSVGVSGDWQNYTATVTGNVSITLTVPTGTLTLNGQALPAGTYTISTSSATLSGSGNTSSPNFSGSVSITSTNGTINLGAGSESLSVGGKPLNPEDETTLDSYTGTISVSANGDGTDYVSLSGNAGNVLQVATTPLTFTTDQNTPITFATNIQTSLADTYNLTANAPPGWTVSIDSSGTVTATPAPGLQSGTYPIQIIAESQADSNLVAQTTVDVTITPTQPGIKFAVNPDPIFTVSFNGRSSPRPSAPRSRIWARPKTPIT